MPIQKSSFLVDSHVGRTYEVRNGIVGWKELLKNRPQESCVHTHTQTHRVIVYIWSPTNSMTTCRPTSVLLLIYDWCYLARHWSHWGQSWSNLGHHWSHLAYHWSHLAYHWSHLTYHWSHLGHHWNHLGHNLVTYYWCHSSLGSSIQLNSSSLVESFKTFVDRLILAVSHSSFPSSLSSLLLSYSGSIMQSFKSIVESLKS